MTAAAVRPSNRLDLDYVREAERFGPPIAPIIDVHSHIIGSEAAMIYRRAAKLYGVELTYSMTPLEQAESVRDLMEGRLRLIAIPDFMNKDRAYAHGKGYIERLNDFHRLGARMAKFWSAPRLIDFAAEIGDPTRLRIDSPLRVEVMKEAAAMGFMFMAHVADPDTWFKTRYRDAARYGLKRDHYVPFETVISRFAPIPWIGAHMGGWPEDLEFLDGLLSRHGNLYLDISATKWMVRELSRHSQNDLVGFLRRWKGRILYGSDIVTSDDHLKAGENKTEMAAKASNPDDAFDLYASRYWAYRTMFETEYDGESPIADPDLAMVDPERFSPLDGPRLTGHRLPDDILRSLYHDAAAELLEPRYADQRTP